MKEKKICPFRISVGGQCVEERCALFDDNNKHPACALLNLSKIMMSVRDHVEQIDMQGIGVYNQDDGL